MKTPAAIAILGHLVSSQSFVKYQNQALKATGQVSTSEKTVRVVEGASLGTCVCDITANQCDAYCCCDQDCSQAVLNVWQADEEKFCGSFIGDSQKPLTKCMDLRFIHKYNQRSDKGMKATEVNGELCVELDTGSSFSEYIMPLPSLQLHPETAYSLADQAAAQTSNNFNLVTYELGQAIYAQAADEPKEFFQLQAAGTDGLCSQQVTVKMLENTGQLSCKLAIVAGDRAQFCTSNLNPDTFVKQDLSILLGSSF